MTDREIIYIVIGGIVGLTSLLTFILVKVTPFMRKLSWALDDFLGYPERSGVRARPGVMARMEQMEVSMQGLVVALDERSVRFDQIEDRIEGILALVYKHHPPEGDAVT